MPSGLHQSWSEFDDHFVVGHYSSVREPQSLNKLEVIPPEKVSVCTLCHLGHISALKEQGELLHRHGPLRGLELFAGAGGLSTGLEASGFVQTKWAVEFSPSAALSYQ